MLIFRIPVLKSLHYIYFLEYLHRVLLYIIQLHKIAKILSFKQIVFLFLYHILSDGTILGASKTASNCLNIISYPIYNSNRARTTPPTRIIMKKENIYEGSYLWKRKVQYWNYMSMFR